MINWIEASKALKYKYDTATEAERFRMLCFWLIDAPYLWGKESIIGTDCSGTICFPLYQMGYNIRVSADFLYKQVFLIHVKNYDDLDKIMAVFYVNEDGRATHVTPIVGSYVVLDADGKKVRTRTARAVSIQFKKQGYDVVWRELNQKQLADLSLSGKYMYGLDPDLKVLRT